MLWLMLILISVVAGLVQTVTGFGAGVVLMMFFPYFMDMITAPALNSAICIALTAGPVWKYRRKLVWRIYGGPLMVLYFTAITDDRGVYTASIQSIFMIASAWLREFTLYR